MLYHVIKSLLETYCAKEGSTVTVFKLFQWLVIKLTFKKNFLKVCMYINANVLKRQRLKKKKKQVGPYLDE